jgi:hypothetical protein
VAWLVFAAGQQFVGGGGAPELLDGGEGQAEDLGNLGLVVAFDEQGVDLSVTTSGPLYERGSASTRPGIRC